jgi:uncharacterized protein (DUF1800 family)
LLDNAINQPAPSPPTWMNESFLSWWRLPQNEQQAVIDAAYKKVYEENSQLKAFWVNTMAADLVSIREKMTLFWHGHFATKFSIDQLMPAQLMYRQNEVFRKLHQGNLRELIEKICVDGAMLIFLNGQDSTKKSPNENFSRELLELYTTGIGHYTEKDVQEGARVFTGWRTNIFSNEYQNKGVYQTFFLPEEHDLKSKSFLGETIPDTLYNREEDVFKDEIKVLVNIILTKRKTETATFICEKLYKYFVYSNGSQTNKEVVNTMAKTLIANNFEIRPVLSQLLKSAFFFDKSNHGIQIKTPAELIVGITKHFDIKADWKDWVMNTLGQELLNPPNVAGWPGYRKWADTRTFPFAVQQISSFIWNQKDDDIMKWIKQFDDTSNPELLIKQICSLFLVRPISAKDLEKYKYNILAGSPDYEWIEILKSPSSAAGRIKSMLTQLVKSPDFHLS